MAYNGVIGFYFLIICDTTTVGFSKAPVNLPHQQKEANMPAIARRVALRLRNPKELKVMKEYNTMAVN